MGVFQTFKLYIMYQIAQNITSIKRNVCTLLEYYDRKFASISALVIFHLIIPTGKIQLLKELISVKGFI